MKSSKMPLSVRRNCHEYCNLDLSLLPPNAVHGAANDGEDDDYDSSHSSYLPSSSSSSPLELDPAVHDSSSMLTTELVLGGGSNGNGSSSPPQQEEQQITIFFNGRVCVSNVTEVQAREILSHARRGSGSGANAITATPPETPGVAEKAGRDRQLHSPINRISMKRSLQRFLQKRKNRVATSLQLQ